MDPVVLPTSHDVPPQRARADSITALRGIIAVLVLIFHALPSLALIGTPTPASQAIIAIFGFRTGRIAFFFVISGYFIVQRHFDDIGHPGAIADFLRRRFDAIYPVYWLILGGLLLLGLSPIGYSHHNYPGNATIIGSILLVGADDRDIVLPTTWTLFHEVLFYLAFAAAMISRRAAIAVAVGWAGLIIASLFGVRPAAVPRYFLDSVNLLFFMGGAAALWVKRGGQVPVRGLLVGAVIAGGLMLNYNKAIAVMPSRLLWGLIWTAAITALVAIEQRRRLSMPAALMTLGKASFLIYLVHIPMQFQSVHLVRFMGWQNFLSPESWLLLSTLIIIGVAIAANMIFEQPLRDRLRVRRERPSGMAVLH